jgi:hypothetical protein
VRLFVEPDLGDAAVLDPVDGDLPPLLARGGEAKDRGRVPLPAEQFLDSVRERSALPRALSLEPAQRVVEPAVVAGELGRMPCVQDAVVGVQPSRLVEVAAGEGGDPRLDQSSRLQLSLPAPRV